jgi:hypothetical protein
MRELAVVRIDVVRVAVDAIGEPECAAADHGDVHRRLQLGVNRREKAFDLR